MRTIKSRFPILVTLVAVAICLAASDSNGGAWLGTADYDTVQHTETHDGIAIVRKYIGNGSKNTDNNKHPWAQGDYGNSIIGENEGVITAYNTGWMEHGEVWAQVRWVGVGDHEDASITAKVSQTTAGSGAVTVSTQNGSWGSDQQAKLSQINTTPDMGAPTQSEQATASGTLNASPQQPSDTFAVDNQTTTYERTNTYGSEVERVKITANTKDLLTFSGQNLLTLNANVYITLKSEVTVND